MASAGNIVFRGTDGTEAEEFIAAIEDLAFTEGWSEDPKRMLLFARSRLRHKALRWFAKLDPSKASDWKLFVEALFDQYPLVEALTEPEISTPVWSTTTFSPHASTVILAPLHDSGPQSNLQDEGHLAGSRTCQPVVPHRKAYDPSIPGRQLGILRVVVEEGTAAPQFLWRGPPSCGGGRTPVGYHLPLNTTIDRHEALLVCFIPSAEPHLIGCLNTTFNFKDLSLTWKPGATTCNICVTPYVCWVNPGQSMQGVESLSKVWKVLSDGSLEASLPAFECDWRGSYTGTQTEDFKTSEVLLDTSDTSIRFVKPGILPWQDDAKRDTQGVRYEFKARIVFEPL